MQRHTFLAHLSLRKGSVHVRWSGLGSGLVRLRSANGVSEKVKLELFLSVTLLTLLTHAPERRAACEINRTINIYSCRDIFVSVLGDLFICIMSMSM